MYLIRFSIAILLCLTGLDAVSGTRNFVLCNDGRYYQYGYCPATLASPAAANIKSVIADGTVSTDKTGGQLYGCVTATATPLSAAQVEACSGGDAVAGISQPVGGIGLRSLRVGGLVPATNYYWQFVHKRGLWASNVSVSAMFTTAVSGQSFDYLGIPYPTESTTQLEALGYSAWPYDPTTVQPPALPSPWTSDVAGFYFVADGGVSGGNGNPTVPRATLPATLAAGDVVVISGDVSDDGTVTASGTSGAPAWIIPDSVGGRFVGDYYTWTGTHLIIDGVDGYYSSGAGTANSITGSFITVRNGVWQGDRLASRQGFSFNTADHVMFFNNLVYDFGNWSSISDDNRHGIKVLDAEQWWVINNIFHDITNDGVQVGDVNSPLTKIGFIAGNVSYNNAQTGFWLKNSYDIILSTNVVYDHIDHPAGAGGWYMLGAQYDFANAWWINNELYGAGGTLYIASSNGTQSQGARYAIGNLIHDTTNPTYDPNNSHSPAAITDRNATVSMVVVNNTLDNVHAGYASPYSGRTVIGNLFSAVTGVDASQMFLYDGTGHSIDYNSYEGTAAVRFGGATPGNFSSLTGAGLESNGIQNSATTFVNALDGDYTPAVGSDAIDAAGAIHAAYAAFSSRYGMSIAVDRKATARPQGAAVDRGAYESL